MDNDRSRIESCLRQEIRAMKPKLPPDLPGSGDFRAVWRLDSLDLVELVARIERAFAIMIADEDVPRFVSLDEVTRYLEARIAA